MVFIGSKLYREQVEVLEPQELRDEIKESLETCLTKYKWKVMDVKKVINEITGKTFEVLKKLYDNQKEGHDYIQGNNGSR